MKQEQFETWITKYRADIALLIADLIPKIDDDYRASECDDTPSMLITISTNDQADKWSYQTGDNSYTGSCYHHPYWGVASIYRDSDPAEITELLIDSLAKVINFED